MSPGICCDEIPLSYAFIMLLCFGILRFLHCMYLWFALYYWAMYVRTYVHIHFSSIGT